MSEPFIVWRFDDAPAVLREMSQHGGDEDWLVEIPPSERDEWVPWIGDGSGPIGCCDISRHEHPTRPGWAVAIGAHA